MPTISQSLSLDGYAILGARAMHDQLAQSMGPRFDAEWPAFADSWNDLAPDAYLAKVGLVRRRRHAVAYFEVAAGNLRFGRHEPHYQSQVYNALQGGIERWFEPVSDEVKASVCTQALLNFAAAQFVPLRPDVGTWKIEIHQFRIETTPDLLGQPTPEGTHRDGVDFVMVTLLERHNILSGTTSVHALDDGRELAHFTLTRPLDTVLIDDKRLSHGVTAVMPDDATQAAWRDVLVITFAEVPEGDQTLFSTKAM